MGLIQKNDDFPVAEQVKNCRLVKIQLKEKDGNEYLLYSFEKDNKWLNVSVRAVNPEDFKDKGFVDYNQVQSRKRWAAERMESINSVFLSSDQKRDILHYCTDLPKDEQHFKACALRVIEEYENTDFKSIFVDLKTIPTKSGRVALSWYGTSIKKSESSRPLMRTESELDYLSKINKTWD